MVQLIDKAALVAEIESKIEKYTKRGEESDANVMDMACIGEVYYPVLMKFGHYVIPLKRKRWT